MSHLEHRIAQLETRFGTDEEAESFSLALAKVFSSPESAIDDAEGAARRIVAECRRAGVGLDLFSLVHHVLRPTLDEERVA